jgi:hypothetical protein
VDTYHYSIANVGRKMESEFECTKIKDGLYLGTLATTQVPPSPPRTTNSYKSTNSPTSSTARHKYPTTSTATELNTSNSNSSKNAPTNSGTRTSRNSGSWRSSSKKQKSSPSAVL